MGSALALAGYLFAVSIAHAKELKCVGPFAKDTHHDRIVATFGDANVIRADVQDREGIDEQVSVIFPKDKEQRIEVVWDSEQPYKKLFMIRLKGTGWSVGRGLRVGMSLRAAEAANGKPFLLYGFDWDYGGSVTDWQGGTLARPVGGCHIVAEFTMTNVADDYEKVSGEREFTSDFPAMRNAKPVVEEIRIGYWDE